MATIPITIRKEGGVITVSPNPAGESPNLPPAVHQGDIIEWSAVGNPARVKLLDANVYGPVPRDPEQVSYPQGHPFDIAAGASQQVEMLATAGTEWIQQAKVTGTKAGPRIKGTCLPCSGIDRAEIS